MSDGRVCKGKKRNGQLCSGYAIVGSDYCFFHDPSRAHDVVQAGRSGGQHNKAVHAGDARQLPVSARTVEDAQQVLAYALAELVEQDNSVARARTLIALAEVIVKIAEISEIEQRIQALENKR